MTAPRHQHGFTLIELVMVIVIMGVIGGMVSVFMKSPIDAYVASAQRAALTDVADTTVRRIARDIRKALPNSVLNPNAQCLEFIPTKTGGRYRAEVDAAGKGDILDFSDVAGDTSFDMLGANSALPDQKIVIGDWIAVYNLGINGANAYNADNISAVTGIAAGDLANETKIKINARQFPLASGGNRFHVIPKDENVVSYVCSGTTLTRTPRAFAGAACPTTGAILASNVDVCSFVYNGSDLQRNALIQLRISFKNPTSGEAASLYHEVHIDNTP